MWPERVRGVLELILRVWWKEAGGEKQKTLW